MSLLYGLHDRQGAPHVPDGGWCVDTLALSEHPAPTAYDTRINWIVRLNWGYGSTGTIPLPVDYEKMAVAATAYVHNSRGANIWIIGNEPNHQNERPNGVYITPDQYARCFAMCRDAIKRSFPNAQVIPAPCAPYHADPVDWMVYWLDMLKTIARNGGCDSIAVHAYTRSSNPADISSGATMGGVLGEQFSGFRTYQNALDLVPDSMCHLPAYITEFNELLDGGWHDANTGVVQAAYAEIDSWNRMPKTQKVHALILYRWPKFDQWYIEGKQGVIDDFNAATGRGDTSPVKRESDMTPTLHIPLVSPGTVTAPALPPRNWDSRLTQRGVTIETPPLAPGQKFWRVDEARWYNEQESQGRHHIYVEALAEDGRSLADVPFLVQWPSGEKEIDANGRDGFDAGNFPMSKSLNEFSIKGNGHYPSEIVKGIGMGADGNSGIHTSTGVVFQLTTMPAASQPSVPNAPTEPTPAPSPMPTGIIEPRVAQAILKVESGGRTHGEDGAIIIRFEAHIFKTHLGNDALWAEHFRTDSARPWIDQMWRPSVNDTWRPIHTGKQADEYAAFEFAANVLGQREAACKSVSMGAAQIMGFNHARVGYDSAAYMFAAFQSAQMQTIGFVNFCLSDPALMDAMRRKDWREVAKRYNGTGAVDTYAPLLEQAYKGLGG